MRSAQVFAAGKTVKTTLDPALFDATAAAVGAQLGRPGDPNAAAASVAPGDGAIRSLFGGLDFLATQFDPASRGGRQPGSAFKPFVYLAALRAGIDPRSVFDATSGRNMECYGDKPVHNYAGRGLRRRHRVDPALVRSFNVAFAELGCQVGVDAVLEAAADAGVPYDATKAQPAVFLGGLDHGVSPLTMAAAYATFASGGVYAEPYAITEIRDAGGEVVYQHQPATQRAFREPRRRPQHRSAGSSPRAPAGPPPSAAPGRQDRDHAGQRRRLVRRLRPPAVDRRVGRLRPRRPMAELRERSVTGGTYPARIFAALMRRSLRGTPPKPLPVASLDDIEVERIDTTTTTPDSTTTTSVP